MLCCDWLWLFFPPKILVAIVLEFLLGRNKRVQELFADLESTCKLRPDGYDTGICHHLVNSSTFRWKMPRYECGESYKLQGSFLISKDHLPVRTRFRCSDRIVQTDLTRTVSKSYPIRNVPLSTVEGSIYVLEKKLLRKQLFQCEQKPYLEHFLQCSVSLSGIRKH